MMRHVVLVGGGHAHVYILDKLRNERWPNTIVTLISPDRYQYYSGMFAGYVEGLYTLNEVRIDLVPLCEAANINLVTDSVVNVDSDRQEVITSSGTRMEYDAISFNIGSRIASSNIPGVEERAVLIKPNFMISKLKDLSQARERLVVVGGGASGIEMSLGLQAYRKGSAFSHPVTLITSNQLMDDSGVQAVRKITKIVQRKGIHLIQNDPVVSVQEKSIELQSGKSIAYDELVWLTGPAAPPLFRTSSLPTDDKGYLSVNENLQSAAYANMFGVGDCIAMESHPSLHKAGVYAVREAPVLWSNLTSYLAGKRLKKYIPQSQYLSILSTGKGEALLLYRGLSFHGMWCHRLKRHIDRSFIRKYQSYSV